MSVAKDTTTTNWYVVNSHRYLKSAIALLRQALICRIDSRLRGIVQPLSVEAPDYAVLPPSHQQIVAQIAATWVKSSRTVLPVIGLSGVDGLSKSAIAAACLKVERPMGEGEMQGW